MTQKSFQLLARRARFLELESAELVVSRIPVPVAPSASDQVYPSTT
jgi:hypothetical protein